MGKAQNRSVTTGSGPVAHLVEHRTCTAGAAGSIPVWSTQTTLFIMKGVFFDTEILYTKKRKEKPVLRLKRSKRPRGIPVWSTKICVSEFTLFFFLYSTLYLFLNTLLNTSSANLSISIR